MCRPVSTEVSRAVLVTGGSGGIGRAIARAFAEHGDRVAVHFDRSAERAEAVLAELPGGPHVRLGADLTDPEQVRTLVDGAADAMSGLDVVVNNAGRFEAHPIDRVSYHEWQQAWQRALGVNLLAAANVVFCALPHLRPGGRVVNVSSRGAFRGEPQSPAYGASKAGLNAFGQSMAVALAPRGIAVATVAPGFVETSMARGVLDGTDGEAVRRQSPFGRVATAAEVAAAVRYLASPAAEWASGAILDLNGASYLRT